MLAVLTNLSRDCALRIANRASKKNGGPMELITLPNGLRIFLNPCDNLRSAIVGVWVLSGSRYENERNNGISHFIEHIVFKGSKKRSGFEIAEGMDEIGAQVNAYTTKQYTFFYVKALDYQLLKGADILFDMITAPRLDKKDIETEKGVILEEIAMCEDDPDDVCYEVNERGIFSGGTMALDILGTRQTVSSFTAEDIREYMAEKYLPSRTVIGVSGSFSREEILAKIREYFGSLAETTVGESFYELPFNKGFYLKTMSTEQNHIMLSFPGVATDSEDLYPLHIVTHILGVGTSSMLNRRIREELGLVYSVDAWLGTYAGGGYWAVSMSLGDKGEEKAIREAVKIISDFSGTVTQRQVDIAKEKVISGLIMAGENPQSRFSSNGRTQLLFSKFTTDDEIINKIKAITLGRVRETAEKYLKLSLMSFTAVGKVKTEQEYKTIVESAINKEGI